MASGFTNFLQDGADSRQDYVTANRFFKPENPPQGGDSARFVTFTLQIDAQQPSNRTGHLLQSVAPSGITGVTHNKNASPGRRAA
jgi:hypothetical protein